MARKIWRSVMRPVSTAWCTVELDDSPMTHPMLRRVLRKARALARGTRSVVRTFEFVFAFRLLALPTSHFPGLTSREQPDSPFAPDSHVLGPHERPPHARPSLSARSIASTLPHRSILRSIYSTCNTNVADVTSIAPPSLEPRLPTNPHGAQACPCSVRAPYPPASLLPP